MTIRWTRALAHRGTLLASTLALGWGLAGCGGTEEADGPPEFSGSGNPPAAGNGNQQSASNPILPGTSTPPNTSNPPSNSPSGQQTGGALPPANSNDNPPANPSNGTPEGNPNGAPLNNGMDNGAGGAMAPGAGGSGAMAPGAGGGGALPPGGDNGNPGNQDPPPSDPPPVDPPPAAPDITCPAGATFCSGFESDTLPMGAIYQSQPTIPLAFDTTVKRSGNRSLRIVSAGGFNIRQVVTPIPGQSFWVRLYIQSSNKFGDNDHDSLFVASTANMMQDNNAESGPEFSEQGNQILINSDDQLFSAAGQGFPQGQGPSLEPGTWYCVEANYNGATGDTQIFVNNQRIINAAGFTRRTYQTFRFGYIGFNTVRTVYFDDVVVAPNQVGCQ